eukprot:1670181-Rhodomonas_salina.3
MFPSPGTSPEFQKSIRRKVHQLGLRSWPHRCSPGERCSLLEPRCSWGTESRWTLRQPRRCLPHIVSTTLDPGPP